MSIMENSVITEMNVKKRDGEYQIISFDKILTRGKNLGKNIEPELMNVNYTELTMKVIDRLFDGIETAQIDELMAQQCASLITTHLDYGALASRIVISNHHKNTNESFKEVMSQLYFYKDIHGEHHPIINKDFYTNVVEHADFLQGILDFNRDFEIDYFGFKTLERAYLMKINGVIVERPQHMWLRVALAIHGSDLGKVKESYDLMSQKYFTHATPTLFNAGTPRQQMSSCYLLAMEDDSIKGIYNTLADCAMISKWAGGIGLHIHNVRATGSHIRGTNGTSNGIVPMLRVFNNTARYVDQGGGRRNGSFAMYLEPWHSDIEQFLEMRKNHGDEEMKARDLFYALWIPDLFMKRVKENGDWTLMCPDKCPGLSDVYGEEFEELYEKYESEERGNKTIPARQLWFSMLDSQIETGTPYMLYKDAANKKSNQKNLGTIKSSNLCTEIIEYSDDTQTAVCNLASIGLSKFVKTSEEGGEPYFDFDALELVTRVATNNLNRVIDLNFYPTQKTRRSNMLHRPIGLGVQGLADVFALMNLGFDSYEARELNKNIFETIYYASLSQSNEIAIQRQKGMASLILSYNLEKGSVLEPERNVDDISEWHYADGTDSHEHKWLNMIDSEQLSNTLKKFRPIRAEIEGLTLEHAGAYSSFEGSPASQGILQFDMWGVEPTCRHPWDLLKESIKKYGIRNSLLVAPMPTASTSQILGNNECFEPFTSNIYTRRTIAGEFVVINKHLMRELHDLGLWSQDTKNLVIANNGSIQNISYIPNAVKQKYKTVWEMSMKSLIEMARDRGAFVCQSQSMNLWMENPSYDKLTAMHFFAWSQGLKTGLYYLRTKAKAAAQKFTIDPSLQSGGAAKAEPDEIDDGCLMCSG